MKKKSRFNFAFILRFFSKTALQHFTINPLNQNGHSCSKAELLRRDGVELHLVAL